MGNFWVNLLVVVQVLAALAMIGLILVQHGKGADMGAAFGSGASGSLFGASGSANFLSRSTAVLATVFFVCTLGLAYFGANHVSRASGSVLDRAAAAAPAASAASSAVSAIPAPMSATAGASAAASAAATDPASAASGAARIPR